MSSGSTKKLRIVGKGTKVDAETSPFCLDKKLNEICVQQPIGMDNDSSLNKKLFSGGRNTSAHKGNKENNRDSSAKVGDGILPMQTSKFLGKAATCINLMSPPNATLTTQPSNN